MRDPEKWSNYKPQRTPVGPGNAVPVATNVWDGMCETTNSDGGSQPVSRVLSRVIIPLGYTSPRTSSDLPESGAGLTIGFLFGLAPGGVCPAVRVTTNAVRSYRTFSPLPTRHPKMSVGGIFSVALSVDSRRPDVIWHPALWSPDFPRSCTVGQRVR